MNNGIAMIIEGKDHTEFNTFVCKNRICVVLLVLSVNLIVSWFMITQEYLLTLQMGEVPAGLSVHQPCRRCVLPTELH